MTVPVTVPPRTLRPMRCRVTVISRHTGARASFGLPLLELLNAGRDLGLLGPDGGDGAALAPLVEPQVLRVAPLLHARKAGLVIGVRGRHAPRQRLQGGGAGGRIVGSAIKGVVRIVGGISVAKSAARGRVVAVAV